MSDRFRCRIRLSLRQFPPFPPDKKPEADKKAEKGAARERREQIAFNSKEGDPEIPEKEPAGGPHHRNGESRAEEDRKHMSDHEIMSIVCRWRS